MNNILSEWDYKPLWERHAAEMTAIGGLENHDDFVREHYAALCRCFDEESFLHYQGLFYPYRHETLPPNNHLFLNTLYWHWVREYAKFEQFGRTNLGFRVQIDVHHTNYDICGKEHLHLHTLQVLNREDHDFHHRINRYANHGRPPLLLRSSSPGSLRCSWQRNHPSQVLPARWVFKEPDTASKEEPYNDKIWLICENCHKSATQTPSFEFINRPSAPKMIFWEEGESDTFIDLDICDPGFFIHIIKRCEAENATGGFYLYNDSRLR